MSATILATVFGFASFLETGPIWAAATRTILDKLYPRRIDCWCTIYRQIKLRSSFGHCMTQTFHESKAKETMVSDSPSRAPGNGPGNAGPPRRIDYRIFDVYSELPDTQKRLADAVLECRGNFSSYSAAELARMADVSKATAARFFRRLGYESYEAARIEARETPHWGSPLYDDSHAGQEPEAHARPASALADHFQRDIDNLSATRSFLSEADIAAAVERLVRAETVWVVGFRNSFALAHYARGLLLNVRGGIRQMPSQAFDLAEDMAGIGTNDLVLVVGFRRWPRMLSGILALLSARGIPTVLITDKTAAGTELPADITLRCQNRGAGMFDSYAAGISLLNYLVTQAGEALGGKARRHLEEVEDLHDALGDI
ncbi:hypothetical protein CCR93_16795 [Rhodobium orientis]|nr:hypothetical protein [Rhodobium orientis]